VFVDKLCIAQHDPALKAKGIRGLSTFLDRSEELPILWSSRYFTRCLDEFAAGAGKYWNGFCITNTGEQRSFCGRERWNLCEEGVQGASSCQFVSPKKMGEKTHVTLSREPRIQNELSLTLLNIRNIAQTVACVPGSSVFLFFFIS
jgi:hypothetical protein